MQDFAAPPRKIVMRKSAILLLGLSLALPTTTWAESPTEIAAIRNAARRGNQGAELLLALIYFEGRGVPQNLAKARQWMQRAAREGQPYAQFMLGDWYAGGLTGLPKDAGEAARWWQKSAAQGQPQAAYHLGQAYLTGKGVKTDPERAEYWLRRAAEAGNAPAQTLLGKMYHEGYGVPRDLEKSHDWLARAAAQREGEAIRFLDFFVRMGEDALQGYRQSGPELEARARQGNSEAQYQLALRYGSGAWGVLQDKQKALYWFHQAAAGGNHLAMRALADVYENGLLGEPKDPRQAGYWRKRAEYREPPRDIIQNPVGAGRSSTFP